MHTLQHQHIILKYILCGSDYITQYKCAYKYVIKNHIKLLDQTRTIRQCYDASDVISDETGNMRLLDALFRRKIPVGLDAPDADALDAFYRHPTGTTMLLYWCCSIQLQ